MSLVFLFSVGTTNQTKDGSTVRKCRVGDRTGSVFFSLWNEQAEAIEAGDILKLTRGLISLFHLILILTLCFALPDPPSKP